ncbi:MAG: hypothetical protein JSR44_07330 [Spirochaetes bacterium]|nr:hypothetical protein [Spirochaetota bacterium]
MLLLRAIKPAVKVIGWSVLFICLATNLLSDEAVKVPRTRISLQAQPIANPGRLGAEIERTFFGWSILRTSLAISLNGAGGKFEDKAADMSYSESVYYFDLPVRAYFLLEDYFGFILGAGITGYNAKLKMDSILSTKANINGQIEKSGIGWLVEFGFAYFVNAFSFGIIFSGSNSVRLEVPYSYDNGTSQIQSAYGTNSINSFRGAIFLGYSF